ncbi:MAG TPA: TetR/AcrR family transcriptional regulator [Solirubrobacterales bacterium]|nr:TetR/AcrR family transcriptional regulator [Solirubrobacterales bacterium]
MVELVAERGYNAVSVAALVKRAHVSKRDFYKRFASKEECFLATYDAIVNHSLRGILAASEGEEEWHERLRLGFLAFAGQIAGNPEAARLALVEAFAVGAGAVERTLRTNRLFEALVAKSLAPANGSPRPPRLLVKGIVAGCGRVARARLLSGDPRQLTLDGDELMEWALSFCDGDVARLSGLGAAGASPVPATAVEPPFGDERAMILSATARLASKEGYATLTVPRVRSAAGVSGPGFHAHFDGVTDCFLATLEMLSDRTLAEAEPFYLTAEDWASGVHRMVARLCRHLAGDPDFADLAFREVFPPGPEAIQWRSEMIAKLAALLRRGAPPKQRPTVFAAEASIGAMWGVIHHFVASGSGEQLPIAAPVLSYLALAPAVGGAAAIDAIVTPSVKARPALEPLSAG